MYFRNYGLRKTWLDKSLKSHVSGEPLDRQHGKRAGTLFQS